MDFVKIFIVDDELDIFDFIWYNFVKEGFEVFIVFNGEDGIKIVE